MSGPDAACPDENVLSSFVEGRLGPAGREALESHLDDCDTCRAVVAGAVSEPGVVPELRAWGSGLAMGTVLAGRYRVVRLLGRGGMGEVYEVIDTEVGVHLALKRIRPLASNPTALAERLRREVKLGRRVVQANVRRIFDLHVEQPLDGEDAPLLFLTMELLEGETLGSALRRGTRFSLREVERLGLEIARALAAAHEARIVVGDLKTDNVILVPAASGGGPRAVLTDFGLARAFEEGAGATQGEAFVGTPAYMAPEQLRGGPASFRSDVYALGLVLKELLQASPAQGAGRERRVLERTSARCLATNPDERFPSGTEALAELARAARVVRARRVGVALGALLFVALVAAMPAVGRHLARPARVRWENRKAQRSVAILGLRPRGGALANAWVATALADMMGRDLGLDATLRVVSESASAQALRNLGAEAGAVPPTSDVARAFERAVAADALIVGTLEEVPGASPPRLHVRLELRTVGSAPEVRRLAIFVDEGNIAAAERELADDVRYALGVSPPTSPPRASATPITALAMRLFAEALAFRQNGREAEAKDKLERAHELEPRCVAILTNLAECYALLGNVAAARHAYASAFELADDVSRVDRLLTEGYLREANNAWAEAADIFGALVHLYPEEISYRRRQAQDLSNAGKRAEALRLLDTWLDPGEAGDPRLLLVKGRILRDGGDHEPAYTVARQARERAATLGYKRDEAELLELMAAVLSRLGRFEEASATCTEGARLAATLEPTPRSFYNEIACAQIAGNRGNYAQAEAGLRKAIAGLAPFGPSEASTLARGILAYVLNGMRRRSEARAVLDELIATARSNQDTYEIAFSSCDLGFVLIGLAELDEAERVFEGGLQAARDQEIVTVARHITIGLGVVAERRGDLERAVRYFAEGAESPPDLALSSLNHLALVSLARGKVNEAAAALDRAAERQKGYEDDQGSLSLEGTRARLGIAQGNFADARRRLTSLVDQQRALGNSADVVEFLVALAEAQLGAGDLRAARDALRQAALLPQASESAALDLMSARVDLADGRAADAAVCAARARRTAEKNRDEPERREAEMLEAEASLTLGRAGAAAELRRCIDEAGSKQFVALAKRGSAALARFRAVR